MKATYLFKGSEIHYYPQTQVVVSTIDLPLTGTLISAIKFMYANQVERLTVDEELFEYKGLSQTFAPIPGRYLQPLTHLSVTCDLKGVVNVVGDEFSYGNIKDMYQGSDGIGIQTNTEDDEMNGAIKEMCNAIADAVYTFKNKELSLQAEQRQTYHVKRNKIS